MRHVIAAIVMAVGLLWVRTSAASRPKTRAKRSDSPPADKRTVYKMMEKFERKVEELTESGLESDHALGLAQLQTRLEQWPTGWGDDMWAFIYGDFRDLQHELEFPDLGITVLPGHQKGFVPTSTGVVLKAIVKIESKTVEGVADAARRINILVGAMTLINWGNSAPRWTSFITSGPAVGSLLDLSTHDIRPLVRRILDLPRPVSREVFSALYWVRECTATFSEHHREGTLRWFFGYWNAFECLIGAVNKLKPREKLTRTDKQAAIDAFFRSRPLTAATIGECYRTLINPGLRADTSHALRICFPTEHVEYMEQCFGRADKENRLYDIRNAISHGRINAEDPEQIIRIGARGEFLRIMVLQLFALFVASPAPSMAVMRRKAGKK